MKVNLHVLEGCNYRCSHCFAQFHSGTILPLSKWQRIVDNCLESHEVDSFNLAGGEPFLYPWLSELITYIHSRHAKCSVITNGSLLDLNWCRAHGSKLDTLGISIDTLADECARRIGRVTKDGSVLDISELQNGLYVLKQQGCRIKVNTVVSDVNCTERLSDDIYSLGAQRWKLLKIKKVDTGRASNVNMCRNPDAYECFLKANGLEHAVTHLAGQPGLSYIDHESYPGMEVIVEPCLVNSYIVVGPSGDLYRNDNPNGSVEPVGNLLTESFQACVGKLPLNRSLYRSRYEQRKAS